MAAEDFKIDKSQSLVVGDKLSDIKAAHNFGLRKGFLVNKCHEEREKLLEFNKSRNCRFTAISNFNNIAPREN